MIRIAETHAACDVLGPGTRFVVWVQGCPLTCRDCVSPQWIPVAGGRDVPVDDLAARIADAPVDGLTVSGGEPFAQAGAVADLITAVRARRDLSTMAYSGFTIEHLRRRGDMAQHRLLGLLDLLVDGPYLAHRHADLRWRGSDNQRVHRLTDRHPPFADDRGAGLQFEVTAGGDMQWLGVPPVAGFRRSFENAMGRNPR